MAAKRRKLVSEDFDLGSGSTTIPTDSGGTRSATKTGIHTFIGSAYQSAHNFSGSDAGAKITAAIAALPSGGGVVDAHGLEGAQTAASTITVDKPTRILLGRTVLTCAGSPCFNITAQGSSVEGLGETVSEIKPAGNVLMFQLATGLTLLKDFAMTGLSATYPTATGIDVTSGSGHQFQRIRATDWGGVPLTIQFHVGAFLNVTDSLFQPAAAFDDAIVVNEGGAAESNAMNRHFANVDAGGGVIDVSGTQTCMLSNCSFNGVTMSDDTKKFTMVGCRITTVGNNFEVKGINHAIVGNVIAGPVVVAATCSGSVISNNVTVGAMTNNSTATDNIIGDNNSYTLFPKLCVGTSTFPGAGQGAIIGPVALTGTAQYALQVAPLASSSATAEAAGIVSRFGTAAAAFTCAAGYGVFIQDSVKGAGSAITNQYGLYIAAQTNGGTNYGFYSAHTGAHTILGTFNASGLITGGNGLTITGAGVQVGAPTAGDKGAGTINVQNDIYKNNTAYTNPDYVFEKHFSGKIEKFAENDGAKDYAGLMPLAEVETYAKENFELPGVGKAEGMFERADILLEKLEEAYLHIFELSKRIERLENK